MYRHRLQQATLTPSCSPATETGRPGPQPLHALSASTLGRLLATGEQFHQSVGRGTSVGTQLVVVTTAVINHTEIVAGIFC